MTLPVLLAHDPAVPHRDQLLDSAAMRPHIHRNVGSRNDARIDPMRIKYRPAESLRVVYRIAGDSAEFVTARTFAPTRIRTSRPAAGADFTVPELGAAFWRFPNDRRLRGIRRLIDPDPELRAHVPGWTRSELVGYAPEKCAVLACLDTAHCAVAFAKVFSDTDSLARARNGHRDIALAIGLNDDVTVPAILAAISAPATVFVAPAQGVRLADLPSDQLPAALYRLGRAVARIHESPIPRSVTPWNRSTHAAMLDAALLVGRVRPNLKHAALLVASHLAATRQDHEERVLLHGDLHLKNAFLSAHRGVSMIDFDQAAHGPAAADIGSLLAALRFRGDSLGDEFLDGYSSIRRPPGKASLAWYTAAALLTERAVRAITRVRVQVLTGLETVIEDARMLAAAARR